MLVENVCWRGTCMFVINFQSAMILVKSMLVKQYVRNCMLLNMQKIVCWCLHQQTFRFLSSSTSQQPEKLLALRRNSPLTHFQIPYFQNRRLQLCSICYLSKWMNKGVLGRSSTIFNFILLGCTSLGWATSVQNNAFIYDYGLSYASLCTFLIIISSILSFSRPFYQIYNT